MNTVKKQRPILGVLVILFVIIPLTRFLRSETFEAGRLVDMVLLFAAGLSAGVLLRTAVARRAT